MEGIGSQKSIEINDSDFLKFRDSVDLFNWFDEYMEFDDGSPYDYISYEFTDTYPDPGYQSS
jgi:hypothetical protein